jgi:hypothetical protein
VHVFLRQHGCDLGDSDFSSFTLLQCLQLLLACSLQQSITQDKLLEPPWCWRTSRTAKQSKQSIGKAARGRVREVSCAKVNTYRHLASSVVAYMVRHPQAGARCALGCVLLKRETAVTHCCNGFTVGLSERDLYRESRCSTVVEIAFPSKSSILTGDAEAANCKMAAVLGTRQLWS